MKPQSPRRRPNSRGPRKSISPRRQNRSGDGGRNPSSTTIGKGIRLLHHDEDIAVVQKPPGTLSARTPGQDGDSVFDAVKEWARFDRPSSPKVGRERRAAWVIHRLDREVGGVMVFALSEKGFDGLKTQIRTRQLKRRYVAVVVGEMPQGEERVIERFVADRGPFKPVKVFSPQEAQALGLEEQQEQEGRLSADSPRLSRTAYRVIAAGNGLSLLEVELDSGRKHQIRSHLASIGHAVAGDRLYGSADKRFEYPALMATDMALDHPFSGKRMHWSLQPAKVFLSQVGVGNDAWPPFSPKVEDEDGVRDSEAQDEGWNHVAGWYDDLLSKRGSDHHEKLVLPGTLRMLDLPRGARVLDLACGQGVLTEYLADKGGIQALGIDASAELVKLARSRAAELEPRPNYLQGDVLQLNDIAGMDNALEKGLFDGATCALALMNLADLSAFFQSLSAVLASGAPCVAVMLHPAFRQLGGRSSWHEQKNRSDVQLSRMVNAYISPACHDVVMNPGQVAFGKKAIVTHTYHRSLQDVFAPAFDSGFLLSGLEEWASQRHSDSGKRATEENRIREEIPQFLALRFVRQ